MRFARTLRCPQCGADVSVVSPGATYVTCEHCSTLLLCDDVVPQDLGRVARAAPLGSRLRRGTEGTYNGAPFYVRGRLQLDHGAGPWNEWAAEDADGRWLWIAEAQGDVFVFADAEPTSDVREQLAAIAARYPENLEVPEKGALRAGDALTLGNERWMILEVGTGEVLTCEGELPVRPSIGGQTRYLDLARGERQVATIDLTRAEPELLIGARVTLADLALDPATEADPGAERLTASRVRCPECDGEIVVHDIVRAVRVACRHCRVILAPDSGVAPAASSSQKAVQGLLAVLQAQDDVKPKSPIPIGSQGVLHGESVQVIGALGKRVRVDRTWYPWRELLLRRSDGGYWWLVESKGHWSLAKPIPATTIQKSGTVVHHGDRRFKHFTSGTAQVHWVLGEFYWRVQKGDTALVDDYTAPGGGLGISFEKTPRELAASRLEHLSASEVKEAFGLRDLKLYSSGVGMVQPNPARPRDAWLICGAVFALLVTLRIVFGVVHAKEVVFDAELGPAPSVVGAETVDLTDPLELRRGPANVRVELLAPELNQGWLGLTGALVDEDTGTVLTFATEASRYSGVSGGERWSEGSSRGVTFVGSVPKGSYRVRLAVQGFDAGLGRPYRVRLTSQVPRTLWIFVLPLPLIGLAIAISIYWMTLESRRWQESDHPWGQS